MDGAESRGCGAELVVCDPTCENTGERDTLDTGCASWGLAGDKA